jgi:hypothetical protein
LISPRLQIFEYTLWGGSNGPPSNPRALLNSLQKSSPDLTVLTLLLVPLDTLCFFVIGAFKRLQQLSIQCSPRQIPVSTDFLLRISARPTLRRLELRGSVELVPSASYTVPNSIDFPMLEDICIDLVWPSVNLLLRSARFPVLRRLVVKLEKESDELDWDQFFATIADATTACLETLDIRNFSGGGLGASNISNMSRLSLTTFARWGLDSIRNDDVDAIISAWPRLINLSLDSDNIDQIDVGFSSLIAVSVGLPRLRKLELVIHPFHLPDIDDVPVGSHQLENMEIQLTNGYEQVPQIVQFVDRLFPNLKSCSVLSDEGLDVLGSQALMQILQKARRDEIVRINLGLSLP